MCNLGFAEVTRIRKKNSRLYITLASPKLLSLGKAKKIFLRKINLVDTPKKNKFIYCRNS